LVSLRAHCLTPYSAAPDLLTNNLAGCCRPIPLMQVPLLTTPGLAQTYAHASGFWPFIEISLPGVRRLLNLDLLLFAPIKIRHLAAAFLNKKNHNQLTCNSKNYV
jgi:hypothetical protein